MEQTVQIHFLMLRGYFTLEKCLVGNTLDELERILGYGGGRLSQGADVYALARLPELNEFELRGYTHWQQGGDLDIQRMCRTLEVGRCKASIRNEVWSLSGRNRPVKLIPKAGEDSYAIGLGVPQWKLVKPVPGFLVKSLVPGATY